ncbi:MAG: helix-turn-helix domain-containing protein [Spirochaetales bacterium]|jgi:transcriptional regulator with XRE-family HTH domain|nr:helix-turn-helix domain-containing protein [Spirochaetales bacterium]
MEIGEQLAFIIERIKKIRHARMISQFQLANRANISQSFLASLESGKKLPSVETIIKIAQALEVNPGDLFPRLVHDNEEIRKEIKNEIKALLDKL